MSSKLLLICNSLWPPYVADADIISLPCGFFFFFLLFFFPRLISAVADFMSTILAYFDINFSAYKWVWRCLVVYHTTLIATCSTLIIYDRKAVQKYVYLLPITLVVQVEQSVRCVCVCQGNNFWIKWPLTYIFAALDPIRVKFESQCYWSKFTVTWWKICFLCHCQSAAVLPQVPYLKSLQCNERMKSRS